MLPVLTFYGRNMGDFISLSCFSLFFTPLWPPIKKKKQLRKPVSQVVSETLTIRESEVYWRSLQPTQKQKGPSRKQGNSLSSLLSMLEKWSSFIKHYSSPGCRLGPPSASSRAGFPGGEAGGISHVVLLVHLDTVCGTSFSLLIFRLLLEKMICCTPPPTIPSWSPHWEQIWGWRQIMAAFLTALKYRPPHQQTKRGML